MHNWHIAHRNAQNARSKRWRGANQERQLELCRLWRANNKERQSELVKRWKDEHPGYDSIYKHNRRARLNGNGGTHTAEEYKNLLDMQDNLCYYCGGPLWVSFDKPPHKEHKIPVSRGGTNDISNIAAACADCNQRKYTRTVEEFLVYSR